MHVPPLPRRSAPAVAWAASRQLASVFPGLSTLLAALGTVALAAVLAMLLAALAPGLARAQDADNGERLYNNPIVAGQRTCGNGACHGGLPAGAQNRIGSGLNAAVIQNAVGQQAQMSFLNGRLTVEQYNDLAAYIARALGRTPTFLAAPPTARPTLAPASLNFGSQPLAQATPLQTVTLGNAASATAALTIATLGVTAGSDFAVAGGTCQAGMALAAGASCTVSLSFRPTIAGTRSGTFTVTHNAGSSTVSLAGQGGTSTPVIGLSPSQLTFAETLGSSAPSQRVLVSNTGQAPLLFSAFALGGQHPAEFSLQASSTCVVGSAVAPGSNCALDVNFTPAAAGTRSAVLTLQHNAAGASSTVALVGQANSTATPNLTLDALVLELGTQALGLAGAPATLTLGNSGDADLRFSALRVTGRHAADMVLGGTCQVAVPLPPQGRCTVTVALRPSSLGSRSALLEIASNALTGLAAISLQGEAISLPAPFVTLSQPALGFGRVTVGTSAVPRVAELSNTGSAVLQIDGITSSSTEFQLTHDCPANLAAGQRCALRVAYVPRPGNAAEQVVIRSNAFSSPNSVVLTGLGVSDALPQLSWEGSPSSLAFGTVETGRTGAGPGLTLVNQGPGEATVSALVLVGPDAGVFSVGGGSCMGGLRLAQGERCTVVLSFAPAIAGPRSASLLVATTGSPPPDIALAGTGATPASGTPMPPVMPPPATPPVTPPPVTPPVTPPMTPPPVTPPMVPPPVTPVPPPPAPPATPTPFVTDVNSLDFRAITVRTGGRSEALTLRITNRSTAAATLRAAEASAGFTVEAGPAGDACGGVPWTLAPGASCTVQVSFTPSTGGSAQGQLLLTAQDNSSHRVALMGEARTEVTNVGAGASSPWWLLALALSALALFRTPHRRRTLA